MKCFTLSIVAALSMSSLFANDFVAIKNVDLKLCSKKSIHQSAFEVISDGFDVAGARIGTVSYIELGNLQADISSNDEITLTDKVSGKIVSLGRAVKKIVNQNIDCISYTLAPDASNLVIHAGSSSFCMDTRGSLPMPALCKKITYELNFSDLSATCTESLIVKGGSGGHVGQTASGLAHTCTLWL